MKNANVIAPNISNTQDLPWSSESCGSCGKDDDVTAESVREQCDTSVQWQYYLELWGTLGLPNAEIIFFEGCEIFCAWSKMKKILILIYWDVL